MFITHYVHKVIETTALTSPTILNDILSVELPIQKHFSGSRNFP